MKGGKNSPVKEKTISTEVIMGRCSSSCRVRVESHDDGGGVPKEEKGGVESEPPGMNRVCKKKSKGNGRIRSSHRHGGSHFVLRGKKNQKA